MQNNQDVILYSWNTEDVFLSERDNLNYVIDLLKINTIYQAFSDDYLNGTDNEFVKTMHKNNISVYHLTGEREWGIGDDMEAIFKQIDSLVKYNKKNKEKIDGIAFDIEPYILDEWEDSMLGTYVNKMKKAYSYAKEKDIYFILIIPYWYDVKSLELTEELFKNAGDEFSIMNYRIKSTIDNIENEVEFAKIYNKKINTIAEVGFGDNDKFANFNKINDDFKEIKAYYDYKISIAYHDYFTICRELFA